MSLESYNVYYSSGTEEDEFMVPQEVKQIVPTVQPKKKGKVTKKRKRVGRACVFCQRSHMSCDEQRPCKRCVARGCGDQCRDGKRKRRGRRPKGRLVAEEEVDDFEPGYNGEELAHGHHHDHDHDNCTEHDHAYAHPHLPHHPNATSIYSQHTYPNIRVVEADDSDDDEDDGEDEEVEVEVDDSQQTAHFDARRALQAARMKQMPRHGLLQAEPHPHSAHYAHDEDSDDSSVTLGGISGRSSPALNESTTQGLISVKPEPTLQSELNVFPGLWEAVTTAAEQAAEDPEYTPLVAPGHVQGVVQCKAETSLSSPAASTGIDIDSFFQMDYLAQRAPGMYGGESFPADFDLVM